MINVKFVPVYCNFNLRIKENLGSIALIIFGYLLGQVESFGEKGDDIGILIITIGVVGLFNDVLNPTQSAFEDGSLSKNTQILGIILILALLYLVWYIFFVGG